MKKLSFSLSLLLFFNISCAKKIYFAYKDFACIELSQKHIIFFPNVISNINITSYASYYKLKDTLIVYSIDTNSSIKLLKKDSIDFIQIVDKSNAISKKYYTSNNINKYNSIKPITKINQYQIDTLYIKRNSCGRSFKVPKDYNYIEINNYRSEMDYESLIPYNDTARYIMRNDSLILLTRHLGYAPFETYYVRCSKKKCNNILKYITNR
jgi:hypothetical protein